MPANSLSGKKYAVYAVNSASDDSLSDKSGSINLRDSEYVDLMENKEQTGNGVLLTGNGNVRASSPSPSISTVDKWGSYWSKRERCCCFCNFLLTVTIAIMITIVVLATKGILDLRQSSSESSADSNQRLPSVDQVVTVPCPTPPQKQQVCLEEACVRLSVGVLSRANLSSDPCQDFYSYACGGYVATTKVTWSNPRQRTNPDEMLLKYMRNITDILADDVNVTDSAELRISKRLFQPCLGFQGASLRQVKDVVASLGGFGFPVGFATPGPDLTSVLQTVTALYGVSPLFKVIVTPGGKIGIINRFSDSLVEELRATDKLRNFRFLRPSDYIYRNEETDTILQAYKTYIANFMAYITGVNETARSEGEFVSMIDEIYHLDVFVNKVMYSEDMANLSEGISRCANPQTVEDLQYSYNYNISWEVFLSSILRDSHSLHNYTICFVSLSNSLTDVLSEFSYTTIRRYLVFSAVVQSDIFDVLPRDMSIFPVVRWSQSAFHPAGVTGTSDTQCVRQLSRQFPIYYLVKHRISITSNIILGRLFSDLIASLEEIINNMYWVPAVQQKHLHDALTGLRVSFEWDNEADGFVKAFQNITEDHFENTKLLIQYGVSEYFKCRHVNTYAGAPSVLRRVVNNIAIPVSSLEPPLLYTDRYPSAFYGGYGSFLAQAVSETFDIDALLRFLTEDKIDHRVALTIAYRLQCLVEEYNKFVLLADNEHTYKIRGDLTKSANFKDSLALRVAYRAYKRASPGETTPNIPGVDLTPDQLFFVTYAQTMCEKTNTRGLHKYYIDVDTTHHPPGKYRVIGTVSNFKPFAAAFHCPVGSRMNPKDKCTLF